MTIGHVTSRSVRRALVLIGAVMTAVAPGVGLAAPATKTTTQVAGTGVGDSFDSAGGFTQASFRPSAVDALRATARSVDGFALWAGTAGGDFGLADDHSTGQRITVDFGGTYDIANAVAGLPDYSILAAGAAGNDLAVAKLRGGSLDPSFATNGRLVVDLGGSDDAAYGIVVQSSGAIVVAGGNAGRMVLLRYRADGTPDPTFGTGGHVATTTTGAARALVVQPDGKLLTVSADTTRFWVSRYSADGQLDAGFGAGGRASAIVGQGAAANALAVQADGRIVVAGGRSGDVAIARFNTDGSLDAGFGTSGLVVDNLGQTEAAYGIAALSSGALVVLGEVDAHHGFHTVYTATGQRDPAIGGPTWTVALRSVGPVWGGSLGAYGTNAADDYYMRQIGDDGRLFGELSLTGLDFGRTEETPADMAVQADGKIVVMGVSNHAIALIRYNPDGTRDPSFGIGGQVRNDVAVAAFSVVIQANGRIVVSALAARYPSAIILLGFRSDGTIDPTFGSGGRALVNQQGRGLTPILVLPDGKLLVGGGDYDFPYLIRLLPDGAPDPTFGTNGTISNPFRETGTTGHGISVARFALQPDGKVLAVDGAGVLHRFNADGVADPSLGGDGNALTGPWPAGSIDALVLQPDGKMLLGGSLYTSGRHSGQVLRYNADGSRDASWTSLATIFDNASNQGGLVRFRALAIQPDGKVLATGTGPTLPIARFLPDGTLDPTFYDRGKLVEQRAGNNAFGAVIVGGNQLLVASAADHYQPQTGFMFSRFFLGTTGPTSYHSLPPVRILDTRNGAPVGSGATITPTVTGVGGVPAIGASAVVLNVTVTQPTIGGFLTVFPYGEARPLASNLNFAVGQTVANLVVAKVGADGKVAVYNNAGLVHVVLDVVGWFGSDQAVSGGTRYTALPPDRILDTRSSAAVGAGGTLAQTVTGVGGVPSTGVSAVVLNVTVTQPTTGGYLTVYPSGTARPLASNLNFIANETVPNLAIVKVGADGKVAVYNNAGSTHVIFDVVGWFGSDGVVTAGLYSPLTPARLLDTRNGAPVAANGTLAQSVTGVGGVPATGVSAVVLNVTVTQPVTGGYLTVYPSGSAPPLASTLNFAAGQTVPNLVIAKVGSDGKLAIFNAAGPTHVIFDVVGWYAT